MSKYFDAADIAAFLNAWPPGDDWYLDECPFSFAMDKYVVNSADGPFRKTTADLGTINWHGKDEPKLPEGVNGIGRGVVEVNEWLQWWLDQQEHHLVTFTIKLNKTVADPERLRAIVDEWVSDQAGWELVK